MVQVGFGPLNTPSFSLLIPDYPDGVIDIPTNAFVTIDASGPDVLVTTQLTGRFPKKHTCNRMFLVKLEQNIASQIKSIDSQSTCLG